MAGLSTFQSGPKGSEVVNLFDNLGPFLAHLDTFGPFQTKINLLPHKDKVGFSGGAFEQEIIWSVWNGLEGCRRAQRVPNDQKQLGWPFPTLLDPFEHFGMLTSLPCFAIFVCFIGAFFGTPRTFTWYSFSPSNYQPLKMKMWNADHINTECEN